MSHNPDIYLLYEYMEKIPFTVRIKVRLDEKIDADVLTDAAREAIGRFPYFAVQVGVDEGQNYTLKHNVRPIAVLPEKDERLVLGSEEVNGHLFAITYRGDSIWFNYSHAPCGAPGGLFWIKTTLYQYMTKKYGKRTVVDDLSFTAEKGEILGLLGPNGAGKSTTMNMLTGYLAPDKGSIELDDKAIR